MDAVIACGVFDELLAACCSFVFPPIYSVPELMSVPGSLKLLQKEMEKPKERKKEKNREKKERRSKSKAAHGNSTPNEVNHKKRKHGERRSQSNEKGDCCTKTTKGSSVELLERSNLTEENGLPCSVRIPSNSSDSTQDSSKRRKLAPPDATHDNHRIILRFKLPLKKHTDVERPCSTGSVAEAQALQKRGEPPATSEPTCLSKRVIERPVLQTPEAPAAITEQPCFSGRNVEPAVAGTDRTQSSSGRRSSSSRHRVMQRQFEELILNWNTPPFQCEFPDEEWLFGTKQQHGNPGSEISRASAAEVADHGSGSCVSSLRYLPEFDTYQLPYVVPF